MEITTVVLILGVLGTVVVSVLTVIFRVFPGKKSNKAGDASVGAMYNVYNQQVADVLKLKDNQIKALQHRVRKYEESGEEEDDEIPPELLEPIAKKLNMSGAQVAMLIQQPFVKKMLGGKVTPETIASLAPLLSGLGKGSNNQQQTQQMV